MKISKRTVSFIAFLLGAMIFTVAAAADVAVGSGYTGAKTAVKTTVAKLDGEVDNFSGSFYINIQVDDRMLIANREEFKFDNEHYMSEKISETQEPGRDKGSFYFYEDAEQYVYYYPNEPEAKYYVQSRKIAEGTSLLGNPFEDEYAKDLEKILDAFVGTLKDTVQVEASEDSKMYIVTMGETQVPALVNALASFVFKYSIASSYSAEEIGLPEITNDIYVTEISGKALENGEGMVESVIGSIGLCGKDENGGLHEVRIEIAGELFDINSTVITPPELNEENSVTSRISNMLNEAYIGTYKRDIVEREGNGFVKTGEAILEILTATEDEVTGRYYETYREGYAPEEMHVFDFTLDEGEYGDLWIHYSENGVEKLGNLQRTGSQGQDLYLNLDIEMADDGMGYSTEGGSYEMIRVFDME